MFNTHRSTVDYGKQPWVANLDKIADTNRNFRTTLWTGAHLQATVMCIPVGETIGLEVHPHSDQFLKIEDGHGLVEMGIGKGDLSFKANVTDGDGIFVPAGTWHNVSNTGDEPLKLFTLYSSNEHDPGVVHTTKKDAELEHRYRYYW